jgi:hypothetical protein
MQICSAKKIERAAEAALSSMAGLLDYYAPEVDSNVVGLPGVKTSLNHAWRV